MRRVLLMVGAVLCMTGAGVPGQTVCPTYMQLEGGAGDQFGRAIDGLGDIDGDGYDDFIVGVPGHDGDRGKAVVYSGVDGTEIRSHTGYKSNSRMGWSVAGGGDFDGDGIGDYVVGSPFTFSDHDGRVDVYSGDSGYALLSTHQDGINGERRGYSVDFLDDMDDDGYDEIIVGCPRFGDSIINAGRVLVIDNGISGPELNWINGADTQAQMGYTVANLGDVNGDGKSDFAVGQRFGNAPVLIFDSQNWHDTLLTAPNSINIDGVGDVNGDGRADFVCGYPLNNYTRLFSGYAASYTGQTANSIRDLTVSGATFVGHAVSGVGLITDDSVPDIMVQGFDEENHAWVFSGSDGNLVHQLPAGGTSDDQLTVAELGDVDDDGYANLAVGKGDAVGWVRIYSCTDADGDGIMDLNDNCPGISNPDQADGDSDGVGDICDNCSMIANADQADVDNDSIGDVCDNCPGTANADQADGDSDTAGDVCDNCPSLANADQADADSDGVGDICDDCAEVVNPAQEDSDSDGVGDSCDNCIEVYNPDQSDPDGDGMGEVCDACPGDFYQCCLGSREPGDITCDSTCNVSDVTHLVDHLFGGGPPPCPVLEAGDVNCSGAVNIVDLSHLTGYLFDGGPVPCDQCP